MDVQMKSRHGPLDIRHIVRDMMKKWIQNICQKVFEVVLFQYSLDSGYMLIGSEFKVVLKSEASSVALVCKKCAKNRVVCVTGWGGGCGWKANLSPHKSEVQMQYKEQK